MAADLERLAREFKGAGQSEIGDGASALAQLARKLKAPESFPITASALSTPVAAEVPSADLITSAVEEYKKGPLTPELVTKTFQTIWQEREKLVPEELAGVKVKVSPCPLTKEELVNLEKKGLRLGYLPPALATQENRHILGKMFPKMQSASVQEGNSVTNDRTPSGWFDYEVSINALYLGTTETQLMDELGRAKRQLLSENQYIVAGQDSKLFTGRYLDEGSTWARVGSRRYGYLVYVFFHSDGSLDVPWFLNPRGSYPYLGGRSSGVNRA